jgi:uncharacterized protein (TIGR02001 family)
MKLKPIIAAVGLAIVATPAMADLKANIGVASNYIWRGVTQSADAAAVSGGVDYTHQSGFYVGTWVSNTTANQYEHDIYGGYNFKAGPVDMDAGYIRYNYPVGNANLNFSEAYLNAKYKQFGGGVALTVSKDGTSNDNDMYLYGSADFEVKKGLTVNLLVGHYNFDDASFTDYTHFHASLHKDDFSIAWDKNDQNGAAGDPRVSVTWTKSLDL